MSLPEQRVEMGEFRYLGMERWKLPEMVRVLPLLIQIYTSLLLSSIGLVLFPLWLVVPVERIGQNMFTGSVLPIQRIGIANSNYYVKSLLSERGASVRASVRSDTANVEPGINITTP